MKREKKVGTDTDTNDTNPGANYSRRRNLLRRRQKINLLGMHPQACTHAHIQHFGENASRYSFFFKLKTQNFDKFRRGKKSCF